MAQLASAGSFMTTRKWPHSNCSFSSGWVVCGKITELSPICFVGLQPRLLPSLLPSIQVTPLNIDYNTNTPELDSKPHLTHHDAQLLVAARFLDCIKRHNGTHQPSKRRDDLFSLSLQSFQVLISLSHLIDLVLREGEDRTPCHGDLGVGQRLDECGLRVGREFCMVGRVFGDVRPEVFGGGFCR